jgi:hypothetical protein
LIQNVLKTPRPVLLPSQSLSHAVPDEYWTRRLEKYPLTVTKKFQSLFRLVYSEETSTHETTVVKI